MRLIGTVACVALLLAGCTGGDDEPEVSADGDVTFASLDLDWPAGDELDPGDPPDLPDGFDADRYDRMVDALTVWATESTLSADVRGEDSPAEGIAAELPEAIGRQVVAYADDAATPRLSAANVFAEDVEVQGAPRVTTAWDAQVAEVDGAPSLTLRLQTRAAYEVKVEDGPTRVIGVLRVHSLITREAAQGGIGVGYAWQEFGASDCLVATDDALRPDGDAATAAPDLSTFVDVGDGDDVQMPELSDDDAVDEEFLERCRAGAA